MTLQILLPREGLSARRRNRSVRFGVGLVILVSAVVAASLTPGWTVLVAVLRSISFSVHGGVSS